MWQYNLPPFGNGQNARNVFGAYRFSPSRSGLAGKTLVASRPLEEIGR